MSDRRKVPASRLDDGRVVWGLKPGDVIVNDDGEPSPAVLAFRGGFAFVYDKGAVEITVAPLQVLKTILVSQESLAQIAEWLAAAKSEGDRPC